MNIVLFVVFAISVMWKVDAAQPQVRYTWMADGNSLWSWCDAYTRLNAKMLPTERFRADFCIGYVNGVIDMQKRAQQSRLFCIPPNMSMGETIREMVADLKMHEDRLNRPSADAAVESLIRAFPCTAK